ncbi:NAC transcription factor 29-like [Olea europaea subsp. europaea]|uniref:NAC transcription factor 29-like n=1 Tax=Olea europaea subsp. europaea TaxID=158383 RepID=A0A8S0V663_OLEEU|nr:NAC transcription factor 29-like [Olea europaea subsp. europaea]
MAMSSRFLVQHQKTRYEFGEDLQLVVRVEEPNLENPREEDEENLRFIEEVNDESSTTKKEFVLPRGYHFHPTAVELLEEYLMKKISRQLLWDTIKEIDFYQYDPAQLPIGEFETLKYGTEGKAYFFTRQQQKYLEGSRLIRSPISNGYWRRCGREIPIHNDSGILGFKTIFVWQEPGYKEDSNWKMTEYRINPTFMEDLSQTKYENYVVCKVRDMSRYKKYSTMEEDIDLFEDEFIFFDECYCARKH